MSFLLFIFAAFGFAIAINLIYPIYRYPKTMVFSFVFGWLVGELALHVIAMQAFIISLVILFGELEGFWDATSFVLLAVSWAILSYHYFSGYKAKFIMDAIVAPHRNDDEVSNWVQHSPFKTSRLTLPFAQWKDSEVEVTKNIVYEKVDGFHLKLDIRKNREKHQQAPVLIQIHGGAWTYGYGSKNEQGIPLMIEMAKQGWICVAIDYRLSPKASFPDHIIDCKKALVWVKEHIAEHGGDPNYIVVTGGSAGGHLSSLLALSANNPSFQPGFEDKDTTVQGCVPFYGIYDLLDEQDLQLSSGVEIIMRKSIIKKTQSEALELYKQMSPVNHVNESAPPFLVIHGDKDSLTSLGEAQYFASRLDETSNQSVEFAEIAGAQHAFDMFPSIRSDSVMLGVSERIRQWYRDSLRQDEP